MESVKENFQKSLHPTGQCATITMVKIKTPKAHATMFIDSRGEDVFHACKKKTVCVFSLMHNSWR